MRKKIGRNDPCPCGSGEKFKVCCLLKIQLLKKQKPDIIPWPCFPEELVIGELLRSSIEFRTFYQAERKKIVKSCYWAHNRALPVGIDHRSGRLPDTKLQTKVQVICLRRVPAILEDAKSIAHELQHFILDIEGFPLIEAKTTKLVNITSALNSMVQDQIVDSRIQKYGFNLWKSYQKKLRMTYRILRSKPIPPANHLDRMEWIFVYVSKILAWELACNKTLERVNKFQLWFNKRYPEIAKEAQKMLALVKEIGYDSPKKQSALFKEIIRRYNLGVYMKL